MGERLVVSEEVAGSIPVTVAHAQVFGPASRRTECPFRSGLGCASEYRAINLEVSREDPVRTANAVRTGSSRQQASIAQRQSSRLLIVRFSVRIRVGARKVRDLQPATVADPPTVAKQPGAARRGPLEKTLPERRRQADRPKYTVGPRTFVDALQPSRWVAP